MAYTTSTPSLNQPQQKKPPVIDPASAGGVVAPSATDSQGTGGAGAGAYGSPTGGSSNPYGAPPQKAKPQEALAGGAGAAPNASPVTATGGISPTYVQTTALNSALSPQGGGFWAGGTQAPQVPGGTEVDYQLNNAQLDNFQGGEGGGGDLWEGPSQDPETARAEFQSWAKQTFGREASPEELQEILQQIGWKEGPISQQQFQAAQEAAKKIAAGKGWVEKTAGGAGEQENASPNFKDVDFDLEDFARKFAPGPEGQAQIDALMRALQNSEWSPERLAAMKEVQKEQALSMRRQGMEGLSEADAARGVSRGGAAAAREGRLRDVTDQSILGAYRDIEERGASGRRQELLSTSSELTNALNSNQARNMAPYELALRKALGEHAASMDLSEFDWKTGSQFDEQRRQFNIQAMLELARFLESQRQFNEGQGFDWAKLNLGTVFPGSVW